MHITAEFLPKFRIFHLHKLLLGIRRMETRASARASASKVFPRKFPRSSARKVGTTFQKLLGPVSDIFAYVINFPQPPIFFKKTAQVIVAVLTSQV